MFTQAIADAICQQLAEGKSLRATCAADGMPAPSTVLDWTTARPAFGEQYARARETGFALLADEIIEISDEEGTTVKRKHGDDEEDVEVVFDSTAVARNRLRVDTRKWMLAKMLPKVYGDKIEQTIKVTRDVQDMTLDEILAELSQMGPAKGSRVDKARPDKPGGVH